MPIFKNRKKVKITPPYSTSQSFCLGVYTEKLFFKFGSKVHKTESFFFFNWNIAVWRIVFITKLTNPITKAITAYVCTTKKQIFGQKEALQILRADSFVFLYLACDRRYCIVAFNQQLFNKTAVAFWAHCITSLKFFHYNRI